MFRRTIDIWWTHKLVHSYSHVQLLLLVSIGSTHAKVSLVEEIPYPYANRKSKRYGCSANFVEPR